MSASAATIQKLPRDSSTRPVDTPEFRALCWSTSFIAIALLGVGLFLHRAPTLARLSEFALWGLLIALADLGSLRIWRNVHFGLDFPLLLALAFLYGPVAAGCVAFIASIDPRELHRDMTIHRALFNRSQIALAVMAAGVVFRGLHGQGEAWPLILFPATAALLADFAINASAVAVAQRLTYRLPWREIPNGVLAPGGAWLFAIPYLAYGLLAILFSALYRQAGAWAFFGFVGPVVMGREVFSRGKKLVEADEHLAVQRRALDRASTQIAEERQDERRRIASALHDDVLQALYNVSIHAQVVRQDLRTGQLLTLEGDVPRLIQANERAQALLRDVVAGLRSSPLGRSGLSDTLQLLTDQLGDESGIDVLCHVEVADLRPNLQLLIYQIAREALVNAVNHSGCRTIRVSLRGDGEWVRLTVEDDGKGFNMAEAAMTNHFGLALMRERAELASGYLHIQTVIGSGTTVAARFRRHT
jgi:signal transduction histidine kinase